MHRSQLETKYLKTKSQTISDYTKNIKIFVVSYTRGKKENIMGH